MKSCRRIVWVVVLLSLLPGRATADPSLRLEAGATTSRWLDTLPFTRIERATRDGTPGYEVAYDIPDHGPVVLFWSRDRIDFGGDSPGSRMATRKLRNGRLQYPQRITSRTLPAVHQGILEIEEAYAKQADGAIRAAEGFVIIAALGDLQPRLRATTTTPAGATIPRGSNGAGKVRNVKPENAVRGSVAATGQYHHAISRPIHRALQDHRVLHGVYKARDPRFVPHPRRRGEPLVLSQACPGYRAARRGMLLPRTQYEMPANRPGDRRSTTWSRW